MIKNKKEQIKEVKRRLRLYKKSITKDNPYIISKDGCKMCKMMVDSCYDCILGEMSCVYKAPSHVRCLTNHRDGVNYGNMDAIQGRYLELEAYLMEKGYIDAL